MARKPRIHYPGALYHVILRGNARQDIFLGDEDRSRYFLLFQEGIERFGHRVHAYSLMTNHVHLALQVGNIPLSRIMQNLSFRYTKWFNWRHNRNGHLFQGRYKSILVDADEYLVQLSAYLHLNPVRAGMVQSPADYPWSSHRAYLGRESITWLTTESVLGYFGGTQAKARRLFDEYVRERISEGHRKEFHRGEGSDIRVLGGDNFVERTLIQTEGIPEKKPTLEVIIRAVEQLKDLQPGELASAGQGIRIARARSLAAWAVKELSDATLTELAKRLGRDVTTMSSSVRRFLPRLHTDDDMAVELERLKLIIEELQSCKLSIGH
jgi:REP element-mobilizing transposase RayT